MFLHGTDAVCIRQDAHQCQEQIPGFWGIDNIIL